MNDNQDIHTDWQHTTDIPIDEDIYYLAGGIWLSIPDAASISEIPFRALADGNNPFDRDDIMALVGEGHTRVTQPVYIPIRSMQTAIGKISGTVDTFTDPSNNNTASTKIPTAIFGSVAIRSANNINSFSVSSTATSIHVSMVVSSTAIPLAEQLVKQPNPARSPAHLV